MRRGLAIYLALFAAASALFLLAPGLDLWASGLFYRPDSGFFLGDWGPARLAYRVVPVIVAINIIGVPLVVLIGRWRGRPLWGIDLKTGVFLVAVLALGPGLLVNAALKDHWGRARPTQITEFGGTHVFTPALLPAAQCERNCSFTAGHPSVVFALVAFGFLATGRRRRRAIQASVLVLGAFSGLGRIVQGGHFLSDVVFSGLLVYGLAWLLYQMIIARDAGGVLWRLLVERFGPAQARWILYGVLTTAATVLAYLYLDRPVALYFRAADPHFVEVFRFITRFGVSTYYLIGAALLFAACRLAPLLSKTSTQGERLKSFAAVPLFVFLSLSVSGLTTDLLKAVFGRARPKLLFANETFGFDWWGTQADFWSFPSGHATTIVALAAALYVLWPRFLPLYAGIAGLVALSRVVIGAHFISDVVFAAFIAIAATGYVKLVLERSGIDLDKAKRGEAAAASTLSWPVRLGFRALPRKVADPEPPAQ